MVCWRARAPPLCTQGDAGRQSQCPFTGQDKLPPSPGFCRRASIGLKQMPLPLTSAKPIAATIEVLALASRTRTMKTPTPNSPKDFLRRAAAALEQSPLKDVQRNARALALSAAGKLDLVTREEFDALQAMLTASSQRIAQLEAQVAALEAQLAATSDKTTAS